MHSLSAPGRAGVPALFEFEQGNGLVTISSEKHYKLVPPDEVTAANLRTYQPRAAD